VSKRWYALKGWHRTSKGADRRDACDTGNERRPPTQDPSSSASTCGLEAISTLPIHAVIVFPSLISHVTPNP
jgi:hypothetical protein